MKKFTNLKSNRDGFTIVELMIALSVLSTILVASTVILIQIGVLYAKGVNSANLQNVDRNIVADISSALQFSGEVPSSCTFGPALPPAVATGTTCYASSQIYSGLTVYAFCIDTTRYSYVLNRELGSDPAAGANTPHVLWRDTMVDRYHCNPLNLSQTTPSDAFSNKDGYEMVGNHMRLTRFKVYPASSTSNVFNVDIWMAYGDSDLVQTEGITGVNPGHSACSGGSGTQFCSVSEITTALTGRVY